MSKKVAYLTGTSGMDGTNLCELLLSKGYEVHGMVRRHSFAETQDKRIQHLSDKIQTHYGDITDKSTIDKALRRIKPDEIYHLSSMSHVRVSFDVAKYTMETNCMGAYNILESMMEYCPEAKIINCASSEMFGLSVDDDNFQRETTSFNPVSPYGISKVCTYNFFRHTRRAYKIFASNIINFNHSGKHRGENFVEQKIAKCAVEIKLGLRKTLDLGNLDSYRDIGNSKDYVRAMWMILNHSEPDDFVVSTMETHSIRNICEIVFGKLGLKWEDHVVIDEKNLRSEELPYLKGDSTKIRTMLGWKPEFTFEDTLDEMIDHWMDHFTKKKYF
jgi:GDPmannose 4,6-dehydratase